MALFSAGGPARKGGRTIHPTSKPAKRFCQNGVVNQLPTVEKDLSPQRRIFGQMAV